MLDTYDRNGDARRALDAITPARTTLPAWRIVPPAPAEQLLGLYHQAEAETGAAGRYLAANNFATDRDHAIYRYNHAGDYVRAVNQYAALIGGAPAAFAGYYRWDVYCRTTAGDVLLPIGYFAAEPIPAADYIAAHPQ